MSKIKHRIRNASAVLAVAGVALGGAAWIRSADGWAGGGVDFKAMAKAGGGVTYEDYEREVRATLACLSDHGLKTKGPTPSGAGRFLKYGYGVDHRTEAERERKEAEADTIYRACYDAHEGKVVDGYVRATTPAPEVLERKELELVDCLRDAGADLPIDPSLDDINRALVTGTGEKVSRCHWKYEDYFVLMPEGA